jgi:hypothetical protein
MQINVLIQASSNHNVVSNTRAYIYLPTILAFKQFLVKGKSIPLQAWTDPWGPGG